MASKDRIFTMKFSAVYPLYVQKAERKNRSNAEVDKIICWLTGYTQTGLEKQIQQDKDFATFFAEAPKLNENAKLIDELAKGKAMEKILRQ